MFKTVNHVASWIVLLFLPSLPLFSISQRIHTYTHKCIPLSHKDSIPMKAIMSPNGAKQRCNYH